MITEIRQWKAKVAELIKDGIILKESIDKHPFPELLTSEQNGKIRDSIIFKKERFEVGDIISIKISYINEEELKGKEKVVEFRKGVRWISIIYSIDDVGFYTKEPDNENRFMRIFMYDYRTHISDDVYLNNKWRWNNNPFEIGDCVEIEVKKI